MILSEFRKFLRDSENSINNYQLIDLKRIEDYKQEVILAYKKRKDAGTLPRNLQYHTAASLRKECLAVFYKRYSEKDAETFKSLYSEERNSAEEYFNKIKTTSADKFKPLDNFLKGNTTDTKDNNIELLAWLIDFQPRPHVEADIYELVKTEWESSGNKPQELSGKELPVSEPEEKTPGIVGIIREEFPELVSIQPINGLLGGNPPENSQAGNNGKFNIPRKFNKAVLSFFAAFVIVGASYFFYDKSNQCMYWNGDEYQTVACDQKIEGANILPEDPLRLKQLKRIKNVSEITRGDIGKVYYSKVNGKVEFYTADGVVDVDTNSIENPTDSRKRLLPLSEHIYREYIESTQP